MQAGSSQRVDKRFQGINSGKSSVVAKGVVMLLPRDNSLSRRQLEVLRLVAEGKGSREIGQLLGISVKTVAYHRKEIMLKTGIHDVRKVGSHE